MVMFHSNLRNLREMSGYSQKEFADLVGIPVTTYRNYENTMREPSYDILIKIADILQVSVGELIGAENGDEKYAALFMMIKQLPPSKLQSVVDFTKFISNYK